MANSLYFIACPDFFNFLTGLRQEFLYHLGTVYAMNFKDQ